MKWTKFWNGRGNSSPWQVLSFSDYIWVSYNSVDKFVAGFQPRLDWSCWLYMNGEVKSNILLTQTNLDDHELNQVVDVAGADCSLQTLSTSLWNEFRSEELHPSSMTSQISNYRRQQDSDYITYVSTHLNGRQFTRSKELADQQHFLYSFSSLLLSKTTNQQLWTLQLVHW